MLICLVIKKITPIVSELFIRGKKINISLVFIIQSHKIKDEKLQYEINREAAKISAWSYGKIDKYKYLTGKEILPSEQSRIKEEVKFTYSSLGKAFEKHTKMIEEQGKKQIDVIANQSKKLEALTNKDDDHKVHYKEIFNELVTERFDKIIELFDEINWNELIYYLKGNSTIKIFDDFNKGIKSFCNNKIWWNETRRISKNQKSLNQI